MGQVCFTQLAPTAPATAVFVALSSMCQIMFSVFAAQVFNGWGQGQGPFLPFSTAPGQLSPVGLCAWQTFSQAYARVPGPSACWAVPLVGEECLCRPHPPPPPPPSGAEL